MRISFLQILAFAAFAITFVVPAVPNAAVITVRQDGTGDYRGVYQAVAASSAGDTIEVGPGTFQEPAIVVNKLLTILSTDGPDSTVLDGQGSVRLLEFTGPNWCTLRGFTITNGGSSQALGVVDYGRVTIRDCLFEGNAGGAMIVIDRSHAVVDSCTFRTNSRPYGGAIYVSGWYAMVEAYDSVFEDNYAGSYGGAVCVGARPYASSLTRCSFTGNSAFAAGGAVAVLSGSTTHVQGCFFSANSSRSGAAIGYLLADGTVIGNTFHENAATRAGEATVDVNGSADAIGNIFSGQTGGYGLSVTTAGHSCNVYWDNEYGPITGAGLGPDEIQADPQFCGAGAGDFTVASSSPAAPAGSPCGQLVGAYPVACYTSSKPMIAVVPDTMTFQLHEGLTGETTLMIGNRGGSELTWQILSTPPPWLDFEPGSGTIPPGYNEFVTLSFDASSLTTGVYHDSLVIGSDDSATPAYVVGVDLTVLRGPDIAVSDTLLSFPDLYVGSTSTLGVFVYNIGEYQLTGAAFVDNSSFVVHDPAFNIAPGDSLLEEVTFHPLTGGVFDVTMTLASDDADGDTLVVRLEGRSLFHTDVVAAPDSIRVLVGIGGRTQTSLTLTNPASADAPVLLDIVFAPAGSPPAAGASHGATGGPDPPCEAWESAGPPASASRVFAGKPRRTTGVTAARGTEFFEDFEAGVLVGWQDGGGVGVKEVTSESAADNTTYSYRETASQAGHHNGVFWDLGPITPQEISFFVRSGSESAYDTYFTLRDSELREVIYFLTLANGMFYVNGNVGGHQTYPYTAEVWYQIEFRDIDFVAKTFDYAVNDSLVQEDIPFRNAGAVSDLARLDLYNYESGAEGWWDEIRISPGPPNRWLLVYPWSAGVPAGQTAAFNVTFDASGLPHGDYEASLYVRADAPDQSPTIATIPVFLSVDSTVAINVDDTEPVPMSFALEQNYPNPFNPATTIAYELPRRSTVTLTVFDVTGRRVVELVHGVQQPGRHIAVWSGKDGAGRAVATGVYFYRLVAGEFERTRKMVLLIWKRLCQPPF